MQTLSEYFDLKELAQKQQEQDSEKEEDEK